MRALSSLPNASGAQIRWLIASRQLLMPAKLWTSFLPESSETLTVIRRRMR